MFRFTAARRTKNNHRVGNKGKENAFIFIYTGDVHE